eukprot:4386022-Amphidinium_carterae.1
MKRSVITVFLISACFITVALKLITWQGVLFLSKYPRKLTDDYGPGTYTFSLHELTITLLMTLRLHCNLRVISALFCSHGTKLQQIPKASC